MELHLKITSNLYGLEKSISLALDFTESNKKKRPVIKFGLDSQLDASKYICKINCNVIFIILLISFYSEKLKLQSIAKSVTTAANFALHHLPSYIDSCMVVHVPEMGYLVAIKEWEQNCNREQLLEFGFHFMVLKYC